MLNIFTLSVKTSRNFYMLLMLKFYMQAPTPEQTRTISPYKIEL